MPAEKRLNTVAAGLTSGLLLPLITLLVIWAVRYEGTMGEFLTSFRQLRMLSKVISLAAIPNLLLFFICIWTNRMHAARGVIFATLLVALLMLVLKIA